MSLPSEKLCDFSDGKLVCPACGHRRPDNRREVIRVCGSKPVVYDPPPNEEFSCLLRGPVVRMQECDTCPGEKTRIKVFKCRLHGECVRRRGGLSGVRGCVGCLDRVSAFAVPPPRVVGPDPLDAVTACVTEFNRPDSLRRLLASLANHFPSLRVDVEPTGGNLSAARNRLADRCRTPFYLMLEEDFVLDSRTDLAAMLAVLEAEPDCGGVSAHTEEPRASGTVGRGQKIWWDRDFVRIRDKVYLVPGRRPTKMLPSGVGYRNCDLVLNFGLFRADMLREIRYDERIPIGSEHSEFFWRVYRDGRWHFAHIPRVMVVHLRDRPGPEYNRPRRRVFPEYVRQKHGVEFVRWAPGRKDVAHPNDLGLPNVVFLTVGRSNSSVLTRMLVEAMGFETGRLDADYHEERSVRHVNECIRRQPQEYPVSMRRALRAIPQPWIIKDPRFRTTLPFWLPYFEPYKPLLLYVTKDPGVVRDSYSRAGWQKLYDPDDARRCEEHFAAWPYSKIRLRVEDLAQAFALWDPTRVRFSGSRQVG